MLVLLAVALAVDQARFVLSFARHWVNEDQTLLWYAARDLGRFEIPQPSFYGQAYFTTWEAAPAELLRWLGVPLWTGVPLATSALVIGPWLLLAAAAWRRGCPGLAITAVATPLLVRNEFLVSIESPGGRAAGIACAMAGVALLVAFRGTPADAGGFALVALGTAFNPTALLLTAPAAVWSLLADLRWRRIALALGASTPAVAWLSWVRAAVAAHPDYDLHGGATFAVSPRALGIAASHIGRYLELVAPELAPTQLVAALVVVAVVAVAVMAGDRVVIVTAAALVLAAVLLLAGGKSLDGTTSPYLAFGRYFHLLPAGLWLVALATATRRRLRTRLALAPPVLASLALVTFAVRQTTFDERFPAIAHLASSGAGAPVMPVARTFERCRLVAAAGSGLAVFRHDRTSAYACAALGYDDVTTLFPAYERRTWLLHEEVSTTRAQFTITDADETLCERVRVAALECERDGWVAVVRGERVDVLDTWRRIDEPLRVFDAR